MKRISRDCLTNLLVLTLGVYGGPMEFERLVALSFLVLKSIPDEVLDLICSDVKLVRRRRLGGRR